MLSVMLNRFIEKGSCRALWLGGGTFGSVYTLGDNKVIRFELCSSKWGNFSGYKSWVEKVVLNSHSKHVPKVYYHSVFSNIELGEEFAGDIGMRDSLMVTIMERLEPLGEDDVDVESLQGHLSGKGYLTWPTPKKGIFSINSIKSLSKKALSEGVVVDDLCYQNIMLRKSDNRIVVTDPCY